MAKIRDTYEVMKSNQIIDDYKRIDQSCEDIITLYESTNLCGDVIRIINSFHTRKLAPHVRELMIVSRTVRNSKCWITTYLGRSRYPYEYSTNIHPVEVCIVLDSISARNFRFSVWMHKNAGLITKSYRSPTRPYWVCIERTLRSRMTVDEYTERSSVIRESPPRPFLAVKEATYRFESAALILDDACPRAIETFVRKFDRFGLGGYV